MIEPPAKFVASASVTDDPLNSVTVFVPVPVSVAVGLAVKPDMQLWQLLGCGLLIAAFGFADGHVELHRWDLLQISTANVVGVQRPNGGSDATWLKLRTTEPP